MCYNVLCEVKNKQNKPPKDLKMKKCQFAHVAHHVNNANTIVLCKASLIGKLTVDTKILELLDGIKEQIMRSSGAIKTVDTARRTGNDKELINYP